MDTTQNPTEIAKSLFGGFVPEPEDNSIRAILYRTTIQILTEDEVKFTENDLDREVEDYRPYAIATAQENHRRQESETIDEWQERLRPIVDSMCELHRNKIAKAYGKLN